MKTDKINHFNNNSKLKVTLDASVPVKDERPIARLHKLFQGFKQQYGQKGAVKRWMKYLSTRLQRL